MAAAVPEALKKKRVQYQAALAKRALAQQDRVEHFVVF